MTKKNQDLTDKNRLTYFLLSRSIFDSPIWSDDPHVLKIFIYLLGTARHKKIPKRFTGFSVKRGELVTSLTDIAENNCYMKNRVLKTMSKQKIMRILNLLEKQGYIKRISDTYGTHISICNYETYQNPKTYKTDGYGTAMERDSNRVVTGVETYNKGNKDNNVNKNIRAQAIERILKAYPKVVLHNDALFAIGNAIQREVDKGSSEDNAIKVIEQAVKDYTKQLDDVKFATKACKWFDGGGYLSVVSKPKQSTMKEY